MASISRRLGTTSVGAGSEALRGAGNTRDISSAVTPTLTKFGVPTGSTGTDARNRGGVLMPKLKYKFRVLVFNFGNLANLGGGSTGVDFTQQVVSTNKPKITYESVEMHSYNSRVYIAGKHQWEEITITLRDDITNTISSLVGAQVQRQSNHFEQTTYGAGINYKFDTVLDILDGGNDFYLERWFMEGCWVTNVNWGELDYSSSDPQTIELTIRYDNATQTDGLMPKEVSEQNGETPGLAGVRA